MSAFSELINGINQQIIEHKDFFFNITDGYRKILFKRTTENGDIWLGVKSYSEKDNFRRVKAKELIARGVNPKAFPEYSQFNATYNYLKYERGLRYAKEFISKARLKSRAEIDRAKDERLFVLYKKRREIYEYYLISCEWHNIRDECFKHHGLICLDCNENTAVDIHHRHYKTLGDECVINDLVPLCRPCHTKRHDKNSLMDKPE